jgi:hypothetical protein
MSSSLSSSSMSLKSDLQSNITSQLQTQHHLVSLQSDCTMQCYNGGTCVLSSNNIMSCSCPVSSGYTGSQCHVKISTKHPCRNINCGRFGRCVVNYDSNQFPIGYSCVCFQGYLQASSTAPCIYTGMSTFTIDYIELNCGLIDGHVSW